MEGYGRRSTTEKYSSNNKGKEPWMSYCYGGDHQGAATAEAPPPGLIGAGFTWPPRCYICSFCKREFRSAQALGGHMNVHRRDKARLRSSQCSPPPLDPPVTNPNPNYPDLQIPNLNMPPPPPAVLRGERIFPVSYSFPFMLSSSSPGISTDDDTKINSMKPLLSEVKELKEFFGSEGTRSNGFIRKSFNVKLDLEIGGFEDEDENLDLELRLGCS